MEFLESRYLYLGLLLFSMAYPIAQSFEHRLRYYKQWPHLAIGIVTMMLLFIPWDVWFTHQGVWWFNESYTTGINIFLLPIEEWLFFIVVPFACVFIYEVLNYFIKKDLLKSVARWFFGILAFVLIALAAVFYDQLYTVLTFSLTGVALIILTLKNPKWSGRFLLMYLVSWLPFLLVNGILTGSMTAAPVVNYNATEIIGVRIFTIPIEDSIYNLLMLLIVIAIYEFRKTRGKELS